MYQIAICDDNPVFLEQLVHMTADILADSRVACEIHRFQDEDRLMEALEEKNCDILLLDILLKRENGIELAKRLREEENDIRIIFISGSQEFLLEGYEVQPIHYLLKPVSRERLQKALMTAVRSKQPSLSLALPVSGGMSVIRVSDIWYAEVWHNKLSLYTNSGVTETVKPISELIAELPAKQFVRCHRSFLINLEMVTDLHRYEADLANGQHIPVSKLYYQGVRRALLEFVSGL